MASPLVERRAFSLELPMQRNGISVVIPTYNCEEFIVETLHAIDRQTLRPNEIIVADDCSSDATLKNVLEAKLSNSLPIRILPGSCNSGGPAAPINRGIHAATYDIITIMDHDDLMEPEKIELQHQALRENPSCGLSLCDYWHFDETGVRPSSNARGQFSSGHRELGVNELVAVVDPERARSAFIRDPGLPRSSSGQMFRKAHWERIGGYRPHMGPTSDFDFVMRSLVAPIAWVDRPLYLKRVHPGNLWSGSLHTTRLNLKIQWDAVRVSEYPSYHPITCIVRQRHLKFLRKLRVDKSSALLIASSLDLVWRDIVPRAIRRISRVLQQSTKVSP